MNSIKPNRVTSWASTSLPWVLVAIVLLLWVGNWYLLSQFVEVDRRGQFGDQFGSVNALFSGLAFAGLISAIILQKRELALQREQLALQREEMRASRLQLEEQARVQEGSRKAAIASLKIEALKVEIRALELEGKTWHRDYMAEFIARVRDTGEEMKRIVEELEG